MGSFLPKYPSKLGGDCEMDHSPDRTNAKPIRAVAKTARRRQPNVTNTMSGMLATINQTDESLWPNPKPMTAAKQHSRKILDLGKTIREHHIK
jgi:hypothetical protein